MADFQEQPEAPLSTTIDTEATPNASGAGQPKLTEAVEKPGAPASLREDLETVFKEDDAKVEAKADEKPDAEKPAKNEKVETPKDGEKTEPEAKAGPEKQVPAKAEAEKGADEPKGEERQANHRPPPKNFLPDSVELWKNTPRAVRRDIEAMEREHETAVTQLSQRAERYEELKPFDELARSNGRDLRESLHKITEIEGALQANPIAGLNRILMEVGPRKADGQPVSLYEVADFIVKQGPQGYQQMMAQRPANDQGNAMVEQLQQQVAALTAKIESKPMVELVERFASRNPRYHELQDVVAHFLQSGMIPASLSPEDKLAAAYDMAVRIRPDSTVREDRPSTEGSEPERRADEGFSGSRSIKSSLGAVDEDVDDQAKGGESIRDSLLAVKRRLRA